MLIFKAPAGDRADWVRTTLADGGYIVREYTVNAPLRTEDGSQTIEVTYMFEVDADAVAAREAIRPAFGKAEDDPLFAPS